MFLIRLLYIYILSLSLCEIAINAQTRTHPYLFFSSSDISNIRARANDIESPSHELWELILNKEANYYLTEQKGAELLSNFQSHENIYSLALAYIISQDSVYLESLKVFLWYGQNTSKYYGDQKGLLDPERSGNDFYFWLGARKIIGECLVYDLLYNDFTPQERTSIKDAIFRDLNNAHMRYNEVQIPLRTAALNSYNNKHYGNALAVWGSALAIAAMTFYGDPDYPEAASDLDSMRSRIITADDSYLKRYFVEGANFEGVVYSFLGIDRVLMMMYILSRFDNVDYFNRPDIYNIIVKIPDWWAYEVYPQPRLPYQRIFNYISASGPSFDWQSGLLSGLLIIGGKYNLPLCQWIFENTIQTIPNLLYEEHYYSSLGRAETPVLFTAFLSYNGLQSIEPSLILPKSKIWYERGLVYCRTSNMWASYDDIQLSVEGHQMVNPITGIYSKGHSHPDKNHFTLTAYGQDFIIENGYAGLHNYILIDDKQQARCPPAPYDAQPSASNLLLISSNKIDYIHGDATDAFNHLYWQGIFEAPYPPYFVKDITDPNFAPYLNPVENAQRYFNFIKETNGLPNYVIIADDIKKDPNAHKYEWIVYTPWSESDNILFNENSVIINGIENPENKLFIHYYNISPSLITPHVHTLESYQSTYESATSLMQVSNNVHRIDLQIPQTVNPYFHIMLLPYKPGIEQPSMVTSVTATNGSILKSTWNNYTDYSIFKHEGIVNSQEVSTDAKLSFIREANSQSVVSYSVCDGSSLSYKNIELVDLNGVEAFVSWDGSTIDIRGSNISEYRCYAPMAIDVRINGTSVNIYRDGNYVMSFTNSQLIESGWNLLSIPVEMNYKGKDAAFPGASSLVFGFNGSGYVIEDPVSVGKGYWVKYSPSQTIVRTGDAVTAKQVSLTEGWNLVGSISTQVPVEEIDLPEGVMRSSFWEFSPATGYASSSFIDPGKGYWLKVSQACDITLHESAPVNQYITNCIGTVDSVYSESEPLPSAPPSAFQVSPAYGAEGISTRATLRWSEPFETADSFKVCWSADPDFDTLVWNSNKLTDTQYTFTGLSSHTLYYWYVKTYIGANYAKSATWKFTSCPAPPTILSPTSDIVSNPPTLRWRRQADAISYRIQISLTSDFSSIVRDTSGLIDTVKTITGLAGSTMYYWRVCDSTLYGPSEWSFGTRYFKVTPPPPPVLTANAYNTGGGIIHPKPTWTAINDWGTVGYKLHRTGFAGGWIYTGTNLSYIDYNTTIGEGDVYVYYYVVSYSTLDNVVSAPSNTVNYCTDISTFKQGIKNPETGSAIPTEFALYDNFPNPFNPTTTIYYALPEDIHVKVAVYNVLGKEVAILADEMQSAGYKSVTFDASDLPSGVYYYRLQAGTFSEVKKMILVR